MMDNEIIEWLRSSLPGETAVAPFATMIARDDEFSELNDTLRLQDGVTIDWSKRRISLENRGSIDFISINQGPKVIKGRFWNHSFELQGPWQSGMDVHDFMSTLLRKIKKE